MTRQLMGRNGAAAVALICAGVAAFAVSFTGCSSSSPAAPAAGSTSACWQAMVQQYQHDIATGATGSFPPACRGVADSVIQSYAGQLMLGNTEAPTP